MDDQILAIYCVCHVCMSRLLERASPSVRPTTKNDCGRGHDDSACRHALLWWQLRTCTSTAWYQPIYAHDAQSQSFESTSVSASTPLCTLFDLLGQTWKELNGESVYIIDSFPVAVCDNYRIPHAHIYHQETYLGYLSSKKRYFYGLKIHLLVTPQGHPVECFLTPGSSSDVRALRSFQFDVPKGSVIYADKAYNDYGMEDLMYESATIELSPIRKENSKRAIPPYMAFGNYSTRLK